MKKRKWSRILPLILAGGLALTSLCACGDKEKKAEKPTSFELALITDDVGVNDGAFNEAVWNAMAAFAEENEMTCQFYESENNEDSYLGSIRRARAKGAKLIVLAGNRFETVAYRAQKEYEDLSFVLIDGVPRDEKFNYKIASNSTSVLFAEQEAGYLAGYAAVCEGYTKLGFMGGEDVPPVKRYGYGFVQGVSAAVKEKNASETEIRYAYMGSFEASDEIESEAYNWYQDGTEVIFASGGSIGESVMAAAETAGEQVIGVDVDQSGMSDTVITSAKKEIGKAITDILKNYKRNNFEGGAILTYSAENDGIGLEMTNSRMTVFLEEDYQQLLKEIKSGDRTIEKDVKGKNVKSLAGDKVIIKVVRE